MTRVWELGRCASDGAGERTWLGLGVVGGRFFGRGVGEGVCFCGQSGGPPLWVPPLGFGLGGLGVFGSGDFVHVFSFLIVVVGPLLDRGTNIFEHG